MLLNPKIFELQKPKLKREGEGKSSRSRIGRKQKKQGFSIKDRKKTKEKKFPVEDQKKTKEIYRKVFGPDNI